MRISLEQQFAISSAPNVLRDFKSCSLLPLVTFQIKEGEWVKEERETVKCLEMSENEDTIYQNIWNAVKTVPGGKNL